MLVDCFYFFHTNVKYNNILDKFEFLRSRAKVKSQWLFLEKTLPWL